MTLQEGTRIPVSQIPQLMEVNRNNVYNTRLFTDVEFSYVTENGDLFLIILLRERWYIGVLPYLNFEERTFREWWADKDFDRLAVGGRLQWRNISGYGDRLDFHLQEGYTRVLQVNYFYPFLFRKAKIDLGVLYTYTANKEIGYVTDSAILQLARLPGKKIRFTQSGMIDFTKRFSPRNRLSFGIGYQYFHPNDTVFELNPYYLSGKTELAYYPIFRLGYSLDQRDWKAFPLKGYRVTLQVRKAGVAHLFSTHHFTQVSVYFSKYHAITTRLNFSWGIAHLNTIGKNIPFFDKHFIGLNGYFLRGYETYVIDATWFQTLHAEIKYGLIPRQIVTFNGLPLQKKFNKFLTDIPIAVYVSLFSDHGYAEDHSIGATDTYLKEKWLRSIGVGLQLLTIYDNYFRFEYSINHFGKTGFAFNWRLPLR